MVAKYYKTGEFAKMANLSIRTIRYYDKIGLLKPTKVAENGYRLYTDKDFIKYAQLYKIMDSAQRIYILGVIVGHLERAGVTIPFTLR